MARFRKATTHHLSPDDQLLDGPWPSYLGTLTHRSSSLSEGNDEKEVEIDWFWQRASGSRWFCKLMCPFGKRSLFHLLYNSWRVAMYINHWGFIGWPDNGLHYKECWEVSETLWSEALTIMVNGHACWTSINVNGSVYTTAILNKGNFRNVFCCYLSIVLGIHHYPPITGVG